MAERTVIGTGGVVRGHVRGEGDVEIEGRVEGDVDVVGSVTIQPGALIRATVRAGRVVVRGAVVGNVHGEQSVALEEGARVVGDIFAPSIGVGRGALLRGKLDTGNVVAVLPLEREAEAKPPSKRTETRTSRPATVSPALRPAQETSIVGARPEASRATLGRGSLIERPSAPTARSGNASTLSGSARTALVEPPPLAHGAEMKPPPPIVPSLKKGARGSLKKKAGG